MKGTIRKWGLIGAVAVVAVLTGCTINGGGWLYSLYGPGKVTFTLNGSTDGPVIEGQGELHDRAANVDAHLEIGDVSIGEAIAAFNAFSACNAGATGELSRLTGQYTPQPKKRGPGGNFVSFVFDAGQGKSGGGDFVFVMFFGGVYDGYVDCGFLQGGNFQVTL